MTIVRDGYSARVQRTGRDKLDWTNDDFARLFLWWLAATYPTYRSGWVYYPDIEDYLFPRFKVATGCQHLKLGSLLRGLRNVTRKEDSTYLDATGRQHTTTQYWVPSER